MFARIKKSGKYQYLQTVETNRQGKKVTQRMISTLGRLDKLQAKGGVGVEALTRSLSQFSEKVLLISIGEELMLWPTPGKPVRH